MGFLATIVKPSLGSGSASLHHRRGTVSASMRVVMSGHSVRSVYMKVSLGDLKYLRRISEGYFRTIPAAPHKPDPRQWRDDQLTLSWLGHATVLINFFGVWILTDPALRARVGVRVGPLVFGPKRYVAPALRIGELPSLDCVLLTHAHMDHLDVGTL